MKGEEGDGDLHRAGFPGGNPVPPAMAGVSHSPPPARGLSQDSSAPPAATVSCHGRVCGSPSAWLHAASWQPSCPLILPARDVIASSTWWV